MHIAYLNNMLPKVCPLPRQTSSASHQHIYTRPSGSSDTPQDMPPGPSTWPFWPLPLFYASLLLATVSQYGPDQRLWLVFALTSDFDILDPYS